MPSSHIFKTEDFLVGSPTPPPHHYRLSSQAYGGFTFDSVGRATPPLGASTPPFSASLAPLNGPPSAAYLPYSIGKTRGTNGYTVPYGGEPPFGQKRSPAQTNKWAPALLTIVKP